MKEKNFGVRKDINRGKYCFLIIVDKWSIELQKEEFSLLYKLLITIDQQFSSIKKNLLDDELINLEIEQLPWYAELDGKKDDWNLRLVFESEEETRSFEMYWPIPIAKKLFYEIKKVWESMD